MAKFRPERVCRLDADPEVMFDYGGPLDRKQSDAKFDRYVASFDQHGFCR